MDSEDDAYILLLLSDGNLPTGAFVASAGLESFVTHGFLTSQETTKGKKNDTLNYVVDFVRDNLNSYARTALPFVSDAHISAQQHIGLAAEIDDSSSTAALQDLQDLDDLYESMTLNHVARRASKTQGVALLSLYSKGFTKPPVLRTGDISLSSPEDEARDSRIGALVDKIKLAVRREETHGHLPICWGVLTAALGLSLGMNTSLYVVTAERKFIMFVIPKFTCVDPSQSGVSSSTSFCTPAACYPQGCE
ncbi:hypothetical protein PHLGIDRAFT_113384 [Phlebiopsis gigantea 11061_1 CR5-6]|uniref:Uncharacterized protein n=1 Tax=Phlebiopsis gigantea (strain 11061_1 CR5-6) TaxID=745531 RepID=A0A0C3PXG0_PHLG1|nr:hypothetical protein PHLGIDRAFT_113384 [Phlebiopsis gigantea 11061_1 CR5-6]